MIPSGSRRFRPRGVRFVPCLYEGCRHVRRMQRACPAPISTKRCLRKRVRVRHGARYIGASADGETRAAAEDRDNSATARRSLARFHLAKGSPGASGTRGVAERTVGLFARHRAERNSNRAVGATAPVSNVLAIRQQCHLRGNVSPVASRQREAGGNAVCVVHGDEVGHT